MAFINQFTSNFSLLAVAIFIFTTFVNGAQIETRKYYYFQSFDGSYLTIGGDNSRGVKVVTEDMHGTDPRQSFWVGAGETHEISPRAQNAFSNLVLGIDVPSSLVFQQIRISLARTQWWKITDIGNKKWSIQNARTGQCLSSGGKNTQLFGTICDLSSANQTWTLTPQ